MTDIVSPDVRSRMMSEIKGKNTRPEIAIRKEMFRRGFRYRLHVKKLPGKPDIVFTKFRAVVFVHGCFWHGHDCPLFRLPSTRPTFWQDKIDRNRQNDKRSVNSLLSSGWRVATVWECSIRGKKEKGLLSVADKLESWLRGRAISLEIRDVNSTT